MSSITVKVIIMTFYFDRLVRFFLTLNSVIVRDLID